MLESSSICVLIEIDHFLQDKQEADNGKTKTDYWEEVDAVKEKEATDTQQTVFCFRASHTHRLRAPVECELRIHSASPRRLCVTSRSWDEQMKVQAGNLLSVKQPAHNRHLVTIVHRNEFASMAESFIFSTVIYARQFLRLVSQTLLHQTDRQGSHFHTRLLSAPPSPSYCCRQRLVLRLGLNARRQHPKFQRAASSAPSQLRDPRVAMSR